MIEGVAFASGGLPVTLADVYRSGPGRSNHIVVLAEASASGFERITPSLSRQIVDVAFDAGGPAPQGRLLVARKELERLGEDAEGWMLVATWSYSRPGTVMLAGIGRARAWLLDGDTVSATVEAHAPPFAAPGLSPFLSTHGLNATFNGMSSGLGHYARTSRIVFASSTVARVPEPELLALARTGAPQAAADAMLAAAVRLTPDRWAVAAVFDPL
ncbi:MAG TPA: hypothetical protein VGM88_09135 [Kofleriaceae bacterium]